MHILQHLKDLYEQYLLANPFSGHPPSLYEPMNYIMHIGGKRIRPSLTMMGAICAGGKPESALPVAHVMEVFHNFTLVHDDIMDEAPSRRGAKTVHIHYNIPTAILCGDNMLIKAYELLLRNDYPQTQQMLEQFTQTAAEICEGQQMDMDFEQQPHVKTTDYLDMIKLKTAVLLGSCCALGSMSADGHPEITQSLYHFGLNAGMGFQVMDDYLDAFGQTEKTGKQVGGDLLAGKKSALFTLLYDQCTQQDQLKLIHLFDKEKTTPEIRKKETFELLHQYHTQDVCLQLMNSYFAKADEILSFSGISPENRSTMNNIVDFLSHRNN
jgi:geranylgeranyl diphosphate synthase type II